MKNLKVAPLLLSILAVAWLMGCASAPEPVVADKDSMIDYVAICSAIDQTQEGKVDRQEFCNYFKDKDLGARTFETLDKQKKGYLTREDVEKKEERLEQVIRLTTPGFTR
ncbi:MAG: hypothetical protein ACOZFS_10365 [Thermodesulfobacteriota bacterium]